MIEIVHKVGDTFLAQCLAESNDSSPFDLNELDISVESSVLSPDGLTRFYLSVEILDQQTNIGRYDISGPTDNWPLGTAYWDIRYFQNGITIATETHALQLLQRVT